MQLFPAIRHNSQVDILGNFEDWDLQVLPPLQDFVDRAKRAQLQVLDALARVPCLLDHPEVKPYQEMVDGYGLGFDLPQGGVDDGEDKVSVSPCFFSGRPDIKTF